MMCPQGRPRSSWFRTTDTGKPPLGVMPRYLWIESNPMPSRIVRQIRVHHLLSAISRFAAAGRVAPPEWGDEADELIATI